VTTTQIISIIVIIVAALALGAFVFASMRKKNAADNRARAEQLRERADTRATTGLPEAEASAREAMTEAEQARLEADRAEERAAVAQQALTQQQAVHEDQIRAADRLDPDVDHRSDDYVPDTSAVDAGTTGDTAGDRDSILEADDRPGRHAQGGAVTTDGDTESRTTSDSTVTSDSTATSDNTVTLGDTRQAGTHADTESTETETANADAPVVDEHGEPVLDEHGNPVEREGGGSHRA
jgi:hypothetical protein